MRKVIKKIDRSLSSIYGAISLLVFFAFYLLVGNLVDYFYGPKVAQTVIFNGPFFAFLLGIIILSLSLSLLKRIPFKKALLGSYIVHIGLICLMCSMMYSAFNSVGGSINLTPNSFINHIYSNKYQISITDKADGLGQFIDLDFSIRPQGLNLDAGPVYLISYLPYSKISNDMIEVAGENSAVLSIKMSSNKLERPKQFYLSTNNLDYQSFYKNEDFELVLVNSKMLRCIKDLRSVNADCASILVRRSLSKVKEELCHENSFLITANGIASLGNNCKLVNFQKTLKLNEQEINLEAYFQDKQFKKDYKASTDYRNSKNDIVKYQLRGERGKISTIFVNESKEIVSSDGRIFDFSFKHQNIKLPFSLYLNALEIIDTKDSSSLLKYRASVTLKDSNNEQDYFLQLNSPINYQGWNIYLDSVTDAQVSVDDPVIKLSFLYDPFNYLKTISVIIFGIGLVVLGFQRKLS